MAGASPAFSVNRLNVSVLNFQMKRDGQHEFWKNDPTICCLWEIHFRFKEEKQRMKNNILCK